MDAATRMLIAYDGSDAAGDAIRVAGALLAPLEAVVVHVRREPLTTEGAALASVALSDAVVTRAVGEYERVAAEHAAAVAERGAALAREAGLRAVAAVQAALAPWRGLLAAAEAHAAGLVLCGSRGQGGLSRAVLGSTSSSLLHHAPLPVLVVPADAAASDGPVVIGYDGSDDARDAIAVTARLLPGRDAIVVNAWSSPVQRSFLGESLLSVPLAEVQEITRDLDAMFAGNAEDLAEEGTARARAAGLRADARAVESAPGAWRALNDVARSAEAALIATGSRGRGALASTVLGSVSNTLVHNAEGPVLVVRAAG